MGRSRASACRTEGAAVAFVHDTNPAAANSLASECPGASVVTVLTEFDWEAVDAAIVSTPPAAHTECVIAAVRAGVPVLMEKPIATTADEAGRIADALSERPVVTAVGYMNRYRPAVRRLHAELDRSSVFGVTCHWLAAAYRRPWWSAAEGGGALNDYATHLVDLCRHLIGEIDEVFAVASGTGGAVSLLFEGGACGSLLYGSPAMEKEICFQVFWHGGNARLEGWDLRSTDVENDTEDVFVVETKAFLAAVRDPAAPRPLSDFADARRTQIAIDAIARSIRTGLPQPTHAG